MATTARQAGVEKRPRKRATDPFGGGIPMALVALAVTGIGFYRTFFSRFGEVDAVHMVHGMVTTCETNGAPVANAVKNLLSALRHRVRRTGI